MTDTTAWHLIHTVVTWAPIVWGVCAVLIWSAQQLKRRAPRLMWAVYFELRPFFLPMVGMDAVMTAIATHGHVMKWGDFLYFIVQVGNWYGWKDLDDDDDDRWRRRRRKLTEKISVVAGRLVVAPAGGR